MEFNALVFQKTNLNNYYRMQVFFFLIFQAKNIMKFSHHHDEVNKKLIENIKMVQTWRQKFFFVHQAFISQRNSCYTFFYPRIQLCINLFTEHSLSN